MFRLQLKSKNFMSLTNEECTIFVAGYGIWRAGVYPSSCSIGTGLPTSTREVSDGECKLRRGREGADEFY